MGKFARSKTPANVVSPVRTTTDEPDALTYEGGAGFTRDPKSELFLLAVTNMVGEETFYEAARDRDRRFAGLVARVAAEDPAWVARFVPFLRERMHLRSASVVMAAEFVKARLAAGGGADVAGDGASEGSPSLRSIVSSALVRADEPAEMLAYWHQAHGRRVPQPVKRGVADAVRRLYTERAALKYDGESRGWRMADVIDLVHPEPVDERQSALFRLLLDRRHNRDDIDFDRALLPIVAARAELEAMPLDDRRGLLDSPDVGERFRAAGVTWEWLSGWLNGPMDAKAWEAVIPSMGYMALLRNLRNFDEAGISDPVRDGVVARLQHPDEVARSRQLPLRFYSAWSNVQSLHYGPALERAVQLSLPNVPSFNGRTLVLVDVSGSMASAMSNRSRAQRWELASLFGSALALRAEKADLVAFQTTNHVIKLDRGGSVLRAVEAFKPFVGGGTETFAAVEQHYAGHDRVVILTDEQAFPHVPSAAAATASGRRGVWWPFRQVPTPVTDIKAPIYTFNLAGYGVGHLPSGELGRYTFGGLNDLAFTAIELIERGRDADWSFLETARAPGRAPASADEGADAA